MRKTAPKEEIVRRIKILKHLINQEKISSFLILNHVNLFYFTGSFYKGALLLKGDEIKIFIKRAGEELISLSEFQTFPLKSLKDILPHLHKGKLYVDLKFLPYFEVQRVLKVFSEFEVEDGSKFIWEVRTLKSEYELACLKKAAKMLALSIKEWLPLLKPGIKEITASAYLEERLRLRGHPGYTRSHLGFELTFGYLISGKEGLYATPFYTGEGGLGVNGFPGGASFKRIDIGEPILFDFSGYYEGYYVDQSRMASFGRPKDAMDFYQASFAVMKEIEKRVKPGMLAEDVWFISLEVVERFGFRAYFMHHGEEMKFVGHGVGLQIDEPPALAEGQKDPLKAGMVLAVEPKFHVPEVGVVGLEDTFYLTPQGLKRITNFDRRWINLKSYFNQRV